jgi:hypothetical protein
MGQPSVDFRAGRFALAGRADGTWSRIDAPLLQVMEKLRPHFDVIRAVWFAYQGHREIVP